MGETSSAIIVVNYNSHQLLADSLAESATGIDHVIVVDSFSTPDERDAVESLCLEHGWHLVTPDVNVGYGVGSNLGVRRASELGARIFIILNPDARLGPGAAQALIATAHAHPTDLIAPVIRRPDGGYYSRGKFFVSLDDGLMRSAAKPARSERELPWLSGACLAFSLQVWELAGGFDSDYFLYWEDVELSVKLVHAGGGLRVIDDIDVLHDEGATHRGDLSKRVKSETYYYYNIRNRLKFAGKLLSQEDCRRWRRSSVSAAWAIICQGGRRQLMHSIAPWRAAWRGTRDGLRDLSLLLADRFDSGISEK